MLVKLYFSTQFTLHFNFHTAELPFLISDAVLWEKYGPTYFCKTNLDGYRRTFY